MYVCIIIAVVGLSIQHPLPPKVQVEHADGPVEKFQPIDRVKSPRFLTKLFASPKSARSRTSSVEIDLLQAPVHYGLLAEESEVVSESIRKRRLESQESSSDESIESIQERQSSDESSNEKEQSWDDDESWDQDEESDQESDVDADEDEIEFISTLIPQTVVIDSAVDSETSESDELTQESDELTGESDMTIPETQEEVNAMDPESIMSLMMEPADIQLPALTTPIGTLIIDEMKGKGRFGTVFKANVLGSGETVAVKVIDFDVVNPGEEDYNQFLLSRFAQARRQSFHQEAAAWKLAAGLLEPNHPSLAFVESFIDGSRGVLVMPYIDNAIPLHQVDFNEMSLEDARTLRDRIVNVVERFQTSGMVHRDLHSENILINVDLLEPHIIDLGLARIGTQDNMNAEIRRLTCPLDIMLGKKSKGLFVNNNELFELD